MPPVARRAFLLALLLGSSAAAHGGAFRPDQIRLDPLDPAHVVVRSDVWGLVETRDAGASWRWSCAEPAGGQSTAIQRQPIAMLPGGALLVGAGFQGLFRAAGSLCDLERVEFFSEPSRCGPNGCLPVDVTAASATEPHAMVLTAGQRAGGGYANLLFLTGDAGATWTALPDVLPQDLFGTAVAVAPSDPDVIYVAGVTVAPPIEHVLLRSADAGGTWTRHSVPIAYEPTKPPVTLRIHAVGAADPDQVFLWADADGGEGVKAPDRLLVTTDGGSTIRLAFTATDDLPGFALTADGGTAYLGSVDDGLFATAVAPSPTDGGALVRTLNAEPTWGLAAIPGGLLVGRQDFGVPSPALMSLARTADEGRTFTPAMVICDVAPLECAAESAVAGECAGLFYGTSNFHEDQQGRRCASEDGGATPSDGGTGGTTSAVDGGAGVAAADASGCGCRAAPAAPGGGPVVAWAVALLAAAARRERRPRRVRSR